MAQNKVYTAIGMMSGTSLDGVDVALIKTDGQGFVERVAFESYPYDDEIKKAIRKAFNQRTPSDDTRAADALVTKAHIDALEKFGYMADVVGFHGQTITHDPENRFTWQIGNAGEVALASKMGVVGDMRMDDVAIGGQGAPLLPLYHAALATDLEKPLAVLNLGGVGNVTFLGERGEKDIIAFDTGPASALIDDCVKRNFNVDFDRDGMIAKRGRVLGGLVDDLMKNPYFAKRPPKSLDRNAWDVSSVLALQPQDAVATLTEFTIRSVYRSSGHFPQKPLRWLVTGGGRKNPLFLKALGERLNVPVEPVEVVGWDGDAMEAEGFAYLAVRSLLSLPITLPGTTGVPIPLTGGTLYKV